MHSFMQPWTNVPNKHAHWATVKKLAGCVWYFFVTLALGTGGFWSTGATLPVARVFAHSVLHMDLQKSFPMCCGHSTEDRCNAWPTAPGDRGTSAAKMAAIREAPEVVARSTTTRWIKGWQHSLRHLVVVKWTRVIFDSSEQTNQEKNARYRIFHSVRNCILYNYTCRIRFTDLYRSLQKYWYRIFDVRRSYIHIVLRSFLAVSCTTPSATANKHKKTIYGIASLGVAIIRDPNRRMIVSTCINKSSK